jgi:hypothetical protein
MGTLPQAVLKAGSTELRNLGQVRKTTAPIWELPVMLIAFLSLVALLFAAGYLVRLGHVVRDDRPTSIPRSHPDQVDTATRPFAQT